VSTYLRPDDVDADAEPAISLGGFAEYLRALRPTIAEHYLVIPPSTPPPWDGVERRAVGRGLIASAARRLVEIDRDERVSGYEW
jgi:hypothetical protein